MNNDARRKKLAALDAQHQQEIGALVARARQYTAHGAVGPAGEYVPGMFVFADQTGRLYTTTTAAIGSEPILLPVSDYVIITMVIAEDADSATVVMPGWATWASLRAAAVISAPHAMFQPDRWRLEAFPPLEELARMFIPNPPRPANCYYSPLSSGV